MRTTTLRAFAFATTAALTAMPGSVRATTIDAATASLVEAPNLEVQEGTGDNRSAIVTVTLRYDNAASPQTVDYRVLPGTATAGLDYVSVPDGTLVFLPGETKKTLEVPIVADALPECPEGFTLRLQHWFHGAPIDVQVTIRDDDSGDGGVMACAPALATDGSAPLEGGTVGLDAGSRSDPSTHDRVDVGTAAAEPASSYPAEGPQGNATKASGCSMHSTGKATGAGTFWFLGAVAIFLGLRRRRRRYQQVCSRE